MKRLNLGCGLDIKEGYINLDKMEAKGVDVVWDLDKFPYPFKDNTFDEIIAFHILEHLFDYGKAMWELNRILKPNGKLHLKVPHFSDAWSHNEFHKTEFSFCNFGHDRPLRDSRDIEKLRYFNFKVIKKRIRFTKVLQPHNYIIEPIFNFGVMPIIWEYGILKNIFPATEIEVVLKKKIRFRCVECGKITADIKESMKHPYCKECFKKVYNDDYEKYHEWMQENHL